MKIFANKDIKKLLSCYICYLDCVSPVGRGLGVVAFSKVFPVPTVAFFTGSRCYVGGLLQLFQQAKQSHGTGGSTNQCVS